VSARRKARNSNVRVAGLLGREEAVEVELDTGELSVRSALELEHLVREAWDDLPVPVHLQVSWAGLKRHGIASPVETLTSTHLGGRVRAEESRTFRQSARPNPRGTPIRYAFTACTSRRSQILFPRGRGDDGSGNAGVGEKPGECNLRAAGGARSGRHRPPRRPCDLARPSCRRSCWHIHVVPRVVVMCESARRLLSRRNARRSVGRLRSSACGSRPGSSRCV